MSAHESERLSAYLDGELPASERAEVETHLAACAECTALLAAMGETDEVARRLPVETPAGYFDSFAGRVRARIADEQPPRVRATPPRARRRLPAWTWAAAAALLLGVITPMTMSRLMRARSPATEVPMAQAPAAPTRPQAPEALPERRVTATGDDEVDAAVPRKREAERGRLDRDDRAAEPEPPFAAPPPAPAPPPAVVPRPGLGAGKRDAPAQSAPPPAAENRPRELRKDAPSLAADLSEGEAREEAPAAGAAARERAMADAMASRATPDPVLGRAASAPKARVVTSPGPAAPAAALEAESRAELATAEKKTVVSEDSRAFAELTHGVPADAPAWRERREAWRAFIAEHPHSAHVDEAWARMIEAGLEAWSAGGDPGDFARARADAAAYLNREGASQKGRIRRLMEDAESR